MSNWMFFLIKTKKHKQLSLSVKVFILNIVVDWVVKGLLTII